MSLTGDQLVRATGCSPNGAAELARYIDVAMTRFAIDSPKRRAHFLGQTAHESGLYLHVEENLNYSADRLLVVFPRYFPTVASAQAAARKPDVIANIVYANRMGNGPTSSGDGWRFRARGFIGITGRDNYTALNAALPQIACISYPEALAATEYAALSAAWFWNKAGCNAAADSGSIERVTRLINGGTIGLADRTTLTLKALAALGVAS